VIVFTLKIFKFLNCKNAVLLIGMAGCLLSCDKKQKSIKWAKPANFPDPVYDLSKNPLTEDGVKLGRMLFYDPVLSKNNKVSCGSCHQQKAAFSHQGQVFSAGVHGEFSRRNSPSIQNMAWSRSFFWDGGVHDLDFVPFNPVQNPQEMGENVRDVIVKLKAMTARSENPDYPEMFKAAFGTRDITTERMMKALSQFMVTLISADSRYDQYVAGNEKALNQEEREGLILFKKKCSGCHTGELFTDHTFKNNGLIPLKNKDLGRYEVTRLDTDQYKFKVPSLRNVCVTAPYMHDGRFKTLEEVLEHYSENVMASNTLDPLLINKRGETGIALTAGEKTRILAFLGCLTDEKFISDTTFADPLVSGLKPAK
jgi:cytochrome c peroxidase